MKRALKFALIFSILSLILIAGAGFLTQKTKQSQAEAETTVPDEVEYITPSVVSENYIQKRIAKTLGKKTAPQPYSSKYQKAAEKVLAAYKKNEGYTLNNPLLIIDPYGTNRTGLYVYFKHDYKATVKYTVSLSATEDTPVISGASIESDVSESDSGMTTKARNFSADLFTNETNMPLTVIEGQIIGLVPGRKNYVSLRLYDENNRQIAKVGYRITLPSMKTVNRRLLESTYDRPVNQLSDGLYFVLGKNGKSNDILVYDNSGVIRADIPVLGSDYSQNVNIKTFDGKLFYAVNNRYYVAVNHLGRVTDIYDIGKNILSGSDFDLSATAQQAVGIGSYNGGKTKNDLIVGINIYNRKTTLLCDMRELLSDYYKKKGSKGSASEPADWLGLNSISFINDDDVLVGCGKNSSIMRINDIFAKPKVAWLISPLDAYMGTKEGDYTLTAAGDNMAMSGQNNVRFDQYVNESTTKYYITMFNNNYTKGGSENSYFCKYLVDEDNRTYAPVTSIPSSYSAEGGSAEETDGNFVIVASAEPGEVTEFNAQGNRLAKFTLPKSDKNYRVVKRDMKGVWFAADRKVSE